MFTFAWRRNKTIRWNWAYYSQRLNVKIGTIQLSENFVSNKFRIKNRKKSSFACMHIQFMSTQQTSYSKYVVIIKGKICGSFYSIIKLIVRLCFFLFGGIPSLELTIYFLHDLIASSKFVLFLSLKWVGNGWKTLRRKKIINHIHVIDLKFIYL